MKFFYKLLLCSFFAFPLSINAQNNFFTDKNESNFRTSSKQIRPIVPTKYRTIELNVNALKQFLATAPMEFTANAATKPVIMSIPMPDGTVSKFSIVESPIQEAGLMAKFPDIKTYSGQGIDDRTATIKLDWTSFGFHAQILSALTEPVYVDPYERGNTTNYISYKKTDLKQKTGYEEVGVLPNPNEVVGATRTTSGFCFGSQLRTYRLAIACTGEYAVAVGGTTAALLHSAIVTTVNRVDGVYEKEVAIRLVLVSNNNLVEYLNGATDPFAGNDNANTLINESQSVITSNIGTANFDIGHTFSTGGGGLAQLGCVCQASFKGRGITGSPTPTGDGYDIDYVAHEMGHQFGGNHTFNAITGNCSGNRNASTSVEPGSGITIMGYAGICSATNDLAAHSIPYFHTVSQGEIGTYSNSGLGNGCAVTTSTGNSAPVVNAGSDYTIPAGTPFMLTGSATDANGDVLTYSWEQIDPGTAGANWNSASNPFFRSFSPTTSPVRYFPQLSDVASGTQTIGEYLPTTTQTLNFRLTARDNRNGGGGVCSDEMVLSLVAGTAFTLSSQTTATAWTGNGTNTATITWNIAGTNTAPYNATNVAILFSADGGLTYPYTLSASTANDGSETVVIPAVNTTKGRVMVKALGNVFFNINTANITVTAASCSAEGAVISPATSVEAIAGGSQLNLSLSPQFGTQTAFTASGTITTSDASTNLVVSTSLTAPTCQQYTNLYNYDVYPFTVSTTGSYTFNRTGTGSIYNFYANSFNPASLCTNWLASNCIGNVTYASMTMNLNAGTVYYLVIGVSGADATTPATTLPFTYSFAVTPPSGGAIYSGSSPYANPGASYSYGYVVVNNATGIVKAISASADLSNATNYPSGTYTVYGISYLTTNAAAIQAYVGSNILLLTNALQNQPGTTCGNLSKNTVAVTVYPASQLPVTFTSLKARKLKNDVLLDWGTATEINSNYFEIERSNNAVSFNETIGTVTAAGNSNTLKNYTLTDRKALKGWAYYRVKQVDNDGRKTYSNIAAINFDKAGGVLIVFPNPTKNEINIEYTATKNDKISCSIIDSKGSIVLQQSINVAVGRNTKTINISTLPNSVYVVKCVDSEGEVSYMKVIKE